MTDPPAIIASIMNYNLFALLEPEGMPEVKNPKVTLVPLLVIHRRACWGTMLMIIQSDREVGEVVRFSML